MHTNLITYDGKTWLVDKYCKELFAGDPASECYYADPIYANSEGKLEVRPAGGCVCYVSRGASPIPDLSSDKMREIYESIMAHYDKTIKLVMRHGMYTEDIEEIEDKLQYFQILLNNL